MIYKKTINNQTIQLDSLVLLRGVAVMLVCFCHFGDPLSAGNHIFSKLFNNFHLYGKFGVEIFFVISGFIIPFSMYQGKYQIFDLGTFLYKRLLRLHPPYLLALFGTLVIMYFSYKTRHVLYPENVLSISKSLFYFHVPADNPVFWTLAVEGQYYIFIGLFYYILVNYSLIGYLLIIPFFLYLGQTALIDYLAILKYFVFFFIGNVAFLIFFEVGNKKLNYFALFGLLVYSYFFYEFPAFLFSTATLFFILFYRKKVSSYFKFIGSISYSIYLIHFPIGIKFINLLKPKINPSYSWLLFIGTTILSILISFLFYKVIEEFSENISKKVKYKSYNKAQY